MTQTNETGYAATLENYNSTALDFIFEETTSDPTSLFDQIKDRIVIVEDERLLADE